MRLIFKSDLLRIYNISRRVTADFIENLPIKLTDLLMENVGSNLGLRKDPFSKSWSLDPNSPLGELVRHRFNKIAAEILENIDYSRIEKVKLSIIQQAISQIVTDKNYSSLKDKLQKLMEEKITDDFKDFISGQTFISKTKLVGLKEETEQFKTKDIHNPHIMMHMDKLKEMFIEMNLEKMIKKQNNEEQKDEE